MSRRSRRRSSRLLLLCLGVGLTLVPGAVDALDQPVAGSKLTIRRSASGKEKMVLVLKDPALAFPTIGSVDDPSRTFGPGLRIELFSANDSERAVFDVPPGRAEPGWKVKAGKTERYRFTNAEAPEGVSHVRMLLMKESELLRVVAKRTGFALADRLGAVGVRVTIGSVRHCALFDAATVRRDEAGVFIARRATATALADCGTPSLGGVTRCGDGFDDESEGCDGFARSKCQFPSDRCTPPGVPNECTCCGGCPKDVGCCGPSIVVGVAPPFCSGSCVSTSCNPPWTCNVGSCVDGTCCMQLGEPCFQRDPLPTRLLPCCPGTETICARPAIFHSGFTGLVCCVVDGGACDSGTECCSDVCSPTGTCAPA